MTSHKLVWLMSVSNPSSLPPNQSTVQAAAVLSRKLWELCENAGLQHGSGTRSEFYREKANRIYLPEQNVDFKKLWKQEYFITKKKPKVYFTDTYNASSCFKKILDKCISITAIKPMFRFLVFILLASILVYEVQEVTQ